MKDYFAALRRTGTVLRFPDRPGTLAWWVRHAGGTAHLAVWRPAEAGRWSWYLVCPNSRRHVGYWWSALEGERRCCTCARLLARPERGGGRAACGRERLQPPGALRNRRACSTTNHHLARTLVKW